MKKILLLCSGILFLFTAKAQLLDPGFEVTDTLGAAHWAPFGFIVMPVDTSCTWTGQDSMQFVTSDAHTGNRAYEIRVATYCANGYGGTLMSKMFTNIDTFADEREPFTDTPSEFTFYYKFTSVMGDEAIAEVYTEMSDGTPVAAGTLHIQQSTSGWVLATMPLTYQDTGAPEFIRVRFHLSNETLHYGTRFTVDDIGHNNNTTGIKVLTQDNADKLYCYPVPAKETLFIRMPGVTATASSELYITDAIGRLIKKETILPGQQNNIQISIAELPLGIYYLKMSAGTDIFTGRFVK